MIAVACGLPDGIHAQLPRGGRDPAGRPARDRARRDVQPTPDLGGHARSIRSGSARPAGSSGRSSAWVQAVGDRCAESEAARAAAGPRAGSCCTRLADWVALRPVRDQLGLTRIRRCYTGGAPLGPDVFRFFHSIGVNLKQIYGQTEICGIAVMHTDDDVKFATVGKPMPGHRDPDRRQRRDPAQVEGRLPRLLRQRGGHRRGASTPTAGCTPATPATSTSTATWS